MENKAQDPAERLRAENAKLAKEGNEKLKEVSVRLKDGDVVTKKVQKKSTSYALKAVKTHVETIAEDNLLTKEEAEKIGEILRGAAEKFIRREYGL